jgi:hypothetical protein
MPPWMAGNRGLPIFLRPNGRTASLHFFQQLPRFTQPRLNPQSLGNRIPGEAGITVLKLLPKVEWTVSVITKQTTIANLERRPRAALVVDHIVATMFVHCLPTQTFLQNRHGLQDLEQEWQK